METKKETVSLIRAFCRLCNAKVPLMPNGDSLFCDKGHKQLALNVLLSGGRC